MYRSFDVYQINIRENRRGNQQWTIQRNWQHWVQMTPDEDKQNKKHTTQYVLDNTKCKENTNNVQKTLVYKQLEVKTNRTSVFFFMYIYFDMLIKVFFINISFEVYFMFISFN
jgi:hypothetical protein